MNKKVEVTRIIFFITAIATSFFVIVIGSITCNTKNRQTDEIIWKKDGAKMRLIPAGEFQMGSNDGRSDEKPVHTVYLDAFWAT